MKTISLTLIVTLALTGCAASTPTRKPFVCTSDDPQVCALAKRVYELELEQQRDRANRSARQTCEFAHGVGNPICNIY